MTNPVQCSVPRAPESVDALIHQATDARSDVRLDSSRPIVHRTSMEEELGHAAAQHIVFEAAKHVFWRTAGAELAMVTVPYDLVNGAISDFEQGEERNVQYHYDMMRGALAVFETRAADPAVAAERASNPAFRDGCDRAERIIAQDSELTERLIQSIRATETEAYSAVVQGTDVGPAFGRRYREDLCFKHAVDFARAHESSGDARWTEIRARVEDACRDANAARANQPIRI